MSVSQSDGWNFTDYRTGQLVQVGGDVIIKDATQTQIDVYSRAETDEAATAALLIQAQNDGTIVRQSIECDPSPTPTSPSQ
jgi:hypothetical protein